MTPPTTFRSWLVDTGERALSSLLQALLVFLPTIAVWDASVLETLLVACFPAVGAVILSAMSAPFPTPSSWILDAVLRVARTFVATTLSVALAAGFDIFSASAWQAAAAGGALAALALVKAILARNVAHTVTPASLAPRPMP